MSSAASPTGSGRTCRRTLTPHHGDNAASDADAGDAHGDGLPRGGGDVGDGVDDGDGAGGDGQGHPGAPRIHAADCVPLPLPAG